MTPRAQFDRLITFEAPTVATVPLGGEEITGWAQVEQAWAKVRYGKSEERRQAAGTNTDQAVTFRVLSTEALRGMTTKGRIVFEGLNYNISGSVTIDGPAAEIEFTAIASKG